MESIFQLDLDIPEESVVPPTRLDNGLRGPRRKNKLWAKDVEIYIPPALADQKIFLDDLPVELKIEIFLNLESLLTLRSLVGSSPSFHQSYLGQRLNILSTVIHEELSPEILFEAHEVVCTSRIANPWTSMVMINYRDRRAVRSQEDPPIPVPIPILDPSSLIEIARLQSTIAAVASKYCHATLPVNPISGIRSQHHRPPSPTELHRIHRALYHIELLSTLLRRDNGRYRGIERNRMGEIFPLVNTSVAGKFTVWEIEELACMYEYMMQTCTPIVSRCLQSLDNQVHSVDENKEGNEDENDGRSISNDHNPPRANHKHNQNLEKKTEHCLSLGLSFFLHLSSTSNPSTSSSLNPSASPSSSSPSPHIQVLESLNHSDPKPFLTKTLQSYYQGRSIPRHPHNAPLTFSSSPSSSSSSFSPSSSPPVSFSDIHDEGRERGLGERRGERGGGERGERERERERGEREASGPNQGLVWLHREQRADAAARGNKGRLRSWGYAIWDRRRLSEWEVKEGKDLLSVGVA